MLQSPEIIIVPPRWPECLPAFFPNIITVLKAEMLSILILWLAVDGVTR